MTMELVAAAAIAGVLSFVAVDRWRQVAARYGLLDVPNQRSAHTQPTPRAGGIAIVALSLAGVVSLAAMHPEWDRTIVVAYVVSALAIAAIGFWDDIRQLPPALRLACQLVCAVGFTMAAGSWSTIALPGAGEVGLGWLGLPLTVVWLLGLLNAYNFMDGIDGLAGAQAIVAGAAWVAFGVLFGQPVVTTLGVLLASTSLGFLGHNWAPARVFMGDVGSVFLGFSFAALPLMAAEAGPRAAAAAVLVVWPFVFDTAFTLVRRAVRGETIWMPHRSHLYQRLLPAGYSHAAVSTLYASLSAVGVLLAAVWLSGGPGAGAAVVVSIPVLAAGLWLFVVRQELRHGDAARRSAEASPVR
jgi:UDP-N-acetylmuramyl pentapeptide phosphotransferase/UDP-N-acetylglucosamine-1-phosphate transferase